MFIDAHTAIVFTYMCTCVFDYHINGEPGNRTFLGCLWMMFPLEPAFVENCLD